MDRQLAALGKRRQIAAEIPHFIAALTAASQGRFVVTLPELFVSTMVDTFGFDLVARPLPLSLDRKSTRLNSSHVAISYAVFCLKKKKQKQIRAASHRWTRARPLAA